MSNLLVIFPLKFGIYLALYTICTSGNAFYTSSPPLSFAWQNYYFSVPNIRFLHDNIVVSQRLHQEGKMNVRQYLFLIHTEILNKY